MEQAKSSRCEGMRAQVEPFPMSIDVLRLSSAAMNGLSGCAHLGIFERLDLLYKMVKKTL